MKRTIFLILLLIPVLIVNAAENITYEVCKTGCEYNSLNTVYTNIFNLDQTKIYNITINIKDSEEYIISRANLFNKYFQNDTNIIKSTLIMKGTGSGNPTIKTNDYDSIGVPDVDHMTIENINFDTTEHAVFSTNNSHNDTYIIFKNCNFNNDEVSITAITVELDNVKVRSKKIGFYTGTYFLTIKNSDIKATGADDGQGFRSDSREKTVIENSTIETSKFTTVNGAGPVNISNSTITGTVYLPGQKDVITNTKINGQVTTSNGEFSYKNLTINSNDEYALGIVRNTCGTNFKPTVITEGQIENLNIEGNPAIGIYGNSTELAYKVNIDKSDLSKAICSIVIDVQEMSPCIGKSDISKIYPTFLAQNYSDLNAQIKNSKVNCGIVESHSSTMNAGNIYFEGSNTWTKQISRGTDKTNNNVVELNKGNIYIDFANKDILRLNVDLSKPIIDYFKAIIPEGKVLGEWRIEDPSILKVVDGKIVPLKVGVTRLVATIDNNNYVLEIEVTEDMLSGKAKEVNPETGAFVSSILIILLIAIGIIFINQKNKRIYKIK